MVEFVIIAIGVAILLGFLGNVLFERTSIPNTLWLLLFGVALGTTSFLPDEFIQGAAGLTGAIAIIGILSDGGLHLDLKKILSHGMTGIFLMLSGLVFSVISAVAVMMFFGFPAEASFLTAVIIAGTSASVIIPIVVPMKGVSDKLKTILSIESVFDTFSIVIALIAIDFIANKGTNTAANGFIQEIMLSMFSAIAIGTIFGFLWAPLMPKLKKYEFSYAATLGAFTLLYAFTELSGASGALAVFFGGVMLANSYIVLKPLFPGKKTEKLDADISKTHSLFAFLIRVFFFVFLGMIVKLPNTSFLGIGLAITLLILVGRAIYIHVYSRTKLLDLSKKEKKIASIMIPRGLSAAVLSVIAFSAKVPLALEIMQIVFSIIIFSIIITTVGVFSLKAGKQTGDEKSDFEEIKVGGEEQQID